MVRSEGRALRRSIEGDERAAAETALIAHLESLDAVCRAGSVGAFVAHDGEPNLMRLIEGLWSRGAVVALPVLEDDPDDFSMRFVSWQRRDVLQSGRYGIPVPPATDSIEPDTLLVSFTGFDSSGNRMGRGAGFFDRYLADFTGRIIGVGFEAQRFDQVPTEPHDVPLPVVVTDLGVRFL